MHHVRSWPTVLPIALFLSELVVMTQGSLSQF